MEYIAGFIRKAGATLAENGFAGALVCTNLENADFPARGTRGAMPDSSPIRLDAGGLQDARHALMADPMTFRLHRLGDGPQRLSLARKATISWIASCSASCGTSSPLSPRRKPKGTFPPRYRPRAFWSAFTWPMRSRMRSRSASAKAAAIVRNSFDRPLPAISPPRSRRWSLTPRS